MNDYMTKITTEVQPISRTEMPGNEPWTPRFAVQTFIHCVPDARTSNGYTDSRQVIVYFKDDEEIARFEGGAMTYTPKFKELCHKLVDKTFAAAPEASYGFPHGAVSSSNAGGNGVTAGETAP